MPSTSTAARSLIRFTLRTIAALASSLRARTPLGVEFRTMPGLLAGKRIVVTGVLTDQSLAYGVAELAQKEGAEVTLTGAGRGLRLTRRIAKRLEGPPEVLELDVTSPEQISAAAGELTKRWGSVDGVLHA